jgi:FAD/FMN-containing dehydrogenase
MADPIAMLEARLPGRVGRPGSAIAQKGARVFCPEAREREPAAVIAVANAEDVAAVLAWAGEIGERVSVRSGGHSFDGAPLLDGGVLLDLQRLASVDVREGGLVAVGPGARVKSIALRLAEQGLAVPIGNCPTVGVGGLCSGGGFGYLTRRLGLTCDSLVAATVVTPAGRTVRCNAESEPELLWALRGGGGCAGIATELMIATQTIATVAGVNVSFRWEAAAEAIVRYSGVMATGPERLDLKLALRTTGADRFIDTADLGPEGCSPGIPFVSLEGHLVGPLDEARELVEPLLDPGLALDRRLDEVSYHDAVLREIPLGFLDHPAPPTLRPFRVASDLGRGRPSRQHAEAIIAVLAALQDEPDLHGGGVVIEPADGAVAEGGADESAFAHRDASLLYEWELFHGADGAGVADHERLDGLLHQLRANLAGHLTGGRYVNYFDRLDTPADLWGANLERLRKISADADPARTIVSRLHPL